MRPENLKKMFRERFGSDARIFRAPGRVNLIGEHTDYNNGFVMPAAIQFNTWVAIAARSDRKLVIYSDNLHDAFEVDLEGAPKPKSHWSDYITGVVLKLEEMGMRISGASLMIHGEVPLGAGLSSSASLEVVTGYALAKLENYPLDRVVLAKLCQQAENEFVGARCGIMDQFICCLGESDRCLMIDCRSLEYTALPFPPDVAMVIGNTMVKHSLMGGEYNIRRSECEQAVLLLSQALPGLTSLRDVTPDDLERFKSTMPETIYRRARHVVTENQRVLQAAAALKAGDLKRFGREMISSHISLRDDYEVSCAELDKMMTIASSQPGVFGARMTGGGFGGCVVSLVNRNDVKHLTEKLNSEYWEKTGIKPEVYVSRASDGVSEII